MSKFVADTGGNWISLLPFSLLWVRCSFYVQGITPYKIMFGRPPPLIPKIGDECLAQISNRDLFRSVRAYKVPWKNSTTWFSRLTVQALIRFGKPITSTWTRPLGVDLQISWFFSWLVPFQWSWSPWPLSRSQGKTTVYIGLRLKAHQDHIPVWWRLEKTYDPLKVKLKTFNPDFLTSFLCP